MGPDLEESAKPPCHPHGGVYYYMQPPAMDVLPSSLLVMYVHAQCLTSMEHNKHNGMLSIKAVEHPSCGTRFGMIYKTAIPSSCWCMFLPETTCS